MTSWMNVDNVTQTSPCPVSPAVVDLLKHRITPESDVKPIEYLFRMFGVPCFPRGELVAVAGKAKSGKTYFLSLLMAVFRGKVMWYDTEQSEQSTQDILVNRIRSIESFPSVQSAVDKDHELHAFNVRCESWESRLAMFAAGIAYLQPDLVVLDGVRDLLSDINDGVEAQRITEQLMALAQQHHCCIVCVLHQNKSDSDRNLRGWIGTELTNKVFEVYSCEKLRDRQTFKVEQTHTRKYDIGRELYYVVDRETGLPVACDRPMEQPRDAQGRWVSPRQNPTEEEKWESLNPTYIVRRPEGSEPAWEWNLRRLFSDALAGKDCLPYGTLMGIALGLSHISDKQVYYNVYKQAIEQGIIVESRHPSTGQQLVSLAGGRLPFEDLPF